MTNANDCQGRRETIVALVLGELDAQAADEIRQHIDNCESCRLLYQSLTQEEEAIQSAFKAVEDRSRAVGDNLVAQFDKGSLKSSFGTAILQRLRLVSSTPRRLAELAAAALIIIGVFVGIYHWAGSNVAWADVVEKFRSVPFFSASIYIKEDVISEPKQMELWMSR
ncbi:MAG: anti-sigma factor family protein, partial [Planctomycetota bacterium]